MLASDIITSLRYELGDMQGYTISDYVLLNCINAIQRLINVELCNTTSDLILSVEELDTSSGSADLPTDYQGIIKLLNASNRELWPNTDLGADDPLKTYYIQDSKLYTDASPVTLYYKKSFPALTSTADNIPLPDLFFEVIKKYTKIYYQGQETAGDATILQPLAKDVYKLVASRNKTRLWRKLPFTV